MPHDKATHVDDPVAAGRRLREARLRAGLSQRRLAFSGCSAAYISRLEAGTRVASPRILGELARRLDVTEEYLATGADTTPERLLEDAELALRLDDVQRAAKLFEHALADARDKRERSRAWEGLAHVSFRSGDPALAVELFERARRSAARSCTSGRRWPRTSRARTPLRATWRVRSTSSSAAWRRARPIPCNTCASRLCSAPR